jgi:O-antigen ligase
MSQSMISTMPAPLWQARPARANANGRLLRLVPLVLLFYSFLLFSPEVQAAVFGVNLPSYRMAMLAMALPALWMVLRDKIGPISPIDAAMGFISLWLVLSFTMVYGFEKGLIRGAGIMIDTSLSYFIARACVKSWDDLRYLLLLCLPGFVFAASALAFESLTGRLWLRPAYISIFGNMTAYEGGEAVGALILEPETRLGLMRAYGPFSHPILAGSFMVGFLPLFYFSGLRSWPFVVGIMVCLSGFFSLSSAAFLSLLIAVGAIGVHHVKPYIPKITWWTLSSMLILLVWSLHMSTKNGIVSVLARVTLTPDTAYYRTMIWEYGIDNVIQNPWFGLGYRQWDRLHWMGESVDAHFLLLAMRHGVIVPVLLLFGMIYGIVRLGLLIPYLSPKDRSLAIGLNLSAVIYLIVGQTVNFFGSSNLVLMIFVAFLASMVSWSNAEVKENNRKRIAYMMAMQNAAMR